MSEANLCLHVRRWLSVEGYETYGEVAAAPGIADIVGERGPLLMVVEAKLHLNLTVMEQAERWCRSANMVYVAVPKPRRKSLSNWLLGVCYTLGFGVLTVSDSGTVEEKVRAPFRRKINSLVRDKLCPEQKNTVSGTNRGGYHTPFKATCNDLKRIVAEAGGSIAVKEAMKLLDHHYSTTASAKTCLIKLIERGIIKDLKVTRNGKEIFFQESNYQP